MGELSLSLAIIVSVLASLLLGVPVAFGLGLVAAMFMFAYWGGIGSLTVIAATSFTTVASFVLLAIPLFLIMSEAILASGVSELAYTVLDDVFKRLRGGIGIASNMFCTLFGAVTGFAPATVLAIGNLAIPEMLRRGYRIEFALGLIGGGATLAILIPPSILMVLYGEVARVSVGKMFIGGVIPGLLASAFFTAYIAIRVPLDLKKKALHNGGGWAIPRERKRVRELVGFVCFMLLILTVLGSIWAGICTPTEAAGVGAACSLVLLFIFRELNPRILTQLLFRSMSISCMLYMVLVGATAFTQMMQYMGLIQKISETVLELNLPEWVVFLGMHSVVFFLGMFVDAASIVCITVPIFLPILKGLQMDLLWFGITLMLNLCVATLTPPVGLNLYVLKRVSPVSVDVFDIAWGCAPFILMLLGLIVIIYFFPGIATWLPSKIA